MTYWQWFWLNLYYGMIATGILFVLYTGGYLVWKMWLESWAENRSDKKHYQTLLDK